MFLFSCVEGDKWCGGRRESGHVSSTNEYGFCFPCRGCLIQGCCLLVMSGNLKKNMCKFGLFCGAERSTAESVEVLEGNEP